MEWIAALGLSFRDRVRQRYCVKPIKLTKPLNITLWYRWMSCNFVRFIWKIMITDWLIHTYTIATSYGFLQVKVLAETFNITGKVKCFRLRYLKRSWSATNFKKEIIDPVVSILKYGKSNYEQTCHLHPCTPQCFARTFTFLVVSFLSIFFFLR